MNEQHIENHMVLPEADEPPEPTRYEIEDATDEVLQRMLRVDLVPRGHCGAGDDWVSDALAEPTTPLMRQLARLIRNGIQTGNPDDVEIGKLVREHIIEYIREADDFQDLLDEQIARDRADRAAEARADREFGSEL